MNRKGIGKIILENNVHKYTHYFSKESLHMWRVSKINFPEFTIQRENILN
jgi:hypothetical protein